MNIVEQSVGEWFPNKVVTEDQLIEMIKKEKDELLEQSWNQGLLDCVNNREQVEKKFKEQGWVL